VPEQKQDKVWREGEREREFEVHDTDVLLDSIGTRGSSSFKMIKSDICDCAVCVNMLSFMLLSSDQLIY
jgi:hypothetical protein